MRQKDKIDVIADAIRPGLSNPSRAREAASAAIGALMAAGYTITSGRSSGLAGVGRRSPFGPAPAAEAMRFSKPVVTNAIAGEGQQRGVFAKQE